MSEIIELGRAPLVTDHATRILERIAIMRNPYFTALEDGSMSREAFRVSQEQFFFAVTFFPRPMAALVGRIPDPQARLDILHNLVEEHGDFEPGRFHCNTFRQFLSTLGSDIERPDALRPAPAVRAFNSALAAACVLDELEVGVACLGIIEHAFALISSRIGRAVVERGWVVRENLIHYRLHAAIDERYAEEFFALVEPRWSDPARRYYVEQGLELGAYAFDRLYRDLGAG